MVEATGDAVVQHDGGEGDLAAAIAEALDAAGVERQGMATTALAPVDEFHIRGRAATLEIAEALRVGAGSRVLDLGSGLGGPARTVAEVTGAHVTGVDLTPSFCAAATAMSSWTGLAERTTFTVGDATRLDLPAASFAARLAESGPPPVSFAAFLGADLPEMTRNQVANLREGAILTAMFVCEA